MENKLLDIINVVRDNKGLITLEKLDASNDLRTDIGFDSLDLAELTVRIEKELGIDIFATGYVLSVGDILAKLNTHSS